MNFLKSIICKLFAPTTVPEGDYIATVTDVKIGCQKHSRLLLVTIKYALEDVDTGIKFNYLETFIDNFYLLRCRDFMWFLEANGVLYADYFDLIGAKFDISVIKDCICGKRLPAIIYNNVVTLPPSTVVQGG